MHGRGPEQELPSGVETGIYALTPLKINALIISIPLLATHTHTTTNQSGNAKYQACSEDYGGPSLQSEPETNNIINYFKSHAPIIGAIDWHSHGQLILRPWGWSMEKTEDDARLKQLGTEMSWEIYQVVRESLCHFLWTDRYMFFTHTHTHTN